jgi:hypothetical protein
MDEIIVRGDPFDCNENTSQEDQRIRSKFQKTKAPPSVSPHTFTPEMGDPFTCYVQEILAKTLFRSDLPTQPPDKDNDAPELYMDKMNYHKAVMGAKHFRESILRPLLEKISSILEALLEPSLLDAILHFPRLTSEKTSISTSEWSSKVGANIRLVFTQTNQVFSILVLSAEAEYIKALHNIFHLEKYVIVMILQSIKEAGATIENYTQAWKTLTTPEFAERPIEEWDDLTFIPFIDNALALQKIIKFFNSF